MYSKNKMFAAIMLVVLMGSLSLFWCPSGIGFAQDGGADCPGALPSRLQIGTLAQVSPGLPNNMRDQPSANGTKIGIIPAESVISVVEGPVCADGYVWWRVQYEDLTGWTVEGGAGEYWLVPIEIPEGLITPLNAQFLVPIHELKGAENVAYGMALNPENPWVALGTGYPNNVVRIWDYRTGETVTVLDPGYEGDARLLSFNPQGDLLAISGLVGDPMQIWHVAEGERIAEFEQAPFALAFSPVADVLAYIDMYDLVLFDVCNSEELLRWPAVETLALALVFNPSGDMLALLDRESATLWNAATGELLVTFEHAAWVTDAAFSADGARLATVHCRETGDSYQGACRHLKIVFWDTQTGERGQVIDVTEPGLILNKDAQLALSPDDTLLALSEGDRLWLFEVETGDQLARYESFPAWNVAFTPDQRYIIGAGTYAVVEVWGVPEP